MQNPPSGQLEPTSATKQHADRRRYRRAEARLTGRMLDASRREHAFLTEDLSPGGARIDGPAPALGSRLIVYLDQLGRVEGQVVRVDGRNSFALSFETSARRREFIAETLIMLLNPERLSPDEAAEGRRTPRYSGKGLLSVETEDGSMLDCKVLDFSLVGASLACTGNPPRLGSWVRAGASFGRVARYLSGGFAIDFAPRSPNQADLHRAYA